MSVGGFACAGGLVLGLGLGTGPDASPHAEGTVIFEERFEGVPDGSSPQALGWTVQAGPEQSVYEIRGGVLRVLCKHNPYNGGYIEKPLPVVRRGVLEFDANIGLEQAGNARGLALTLDLYNLALWWHDYCRDWRRYFPEPTAARLPGFSIEPVGHRSLGPVEKGRWTHYKVLFDTDADRIEYYAGDMVDPVYIDSSVAVLGRSEYQGGRLRIGNLGFVDGPVVYGLDNLVVRRLEAGAEAAGAGRRQGLLVFRGMAMERYRTEEIVQALAEPEVRQYTVVFWRAAPYAKNMIKLDRLPAAATVARARAILLVDMPCGPGAVMPDFLLRQIAESVYGGASLVVLGGLFALGKGACKGTALESILPVELAGPWEVRRAETPLELQQPAAGLGPLDWSRRPSVFYYHEVKVRPGAEVLLQAGPHPILVRARVGQGAVTVFTGTPCGAGTSDHPGFWQWADWPRLAARFLALP